MKKSLFDIKSKNKLYDNFKVQSVNELIVITAVDTRDGNRYVVDSLLPENFIW